LRENDHQHRGEAIARIERLLVLPCDVTFKIGGHDV